MVNKYCLNCNDYTELLFAIIQNKSIINEDLKFHYEDANYWTSEIILSMFHLIRTIVSYERHISIPQNFPLELRNLLETKCHTIDLTGERLIDFLFDTPQPSLLNEYRLKLNNAQINHNSYNIINQLKEKVEQATEEEILIAIRKIYTNE